MRASEYGVIWGNFMSLRKGRESFIWFFSTLRCVFLSPLARHSFPHIPLPLLRSPHLVILSCMPLYVMLLLNTEQFPSQRRLQLSFAWIICDSEEVLAYPVFGLLVGGCKPGWSTCEFDLRRTHILRHSTAIYFARFFSSLSPCAFFFFFIRVGENNKSEDDNKKKNLRITMGLMVSRAKEMKLNTGKKRVFGRSFLCFPTPPESLPLRLCEIRTLILSHETSKFEHKITSCRVVAFSISFVVVFRPEKERRRKTVCMENGRHRWRVEKWEKSEERE